MSMPGMIRESKHESRRDDMFVAWILTQKPAEAGWWWFLGVNVVTMLKHGAVLMVCSYRR
jgi:hypothetical protein